MKKRNLQKHDKIIQKEKQLDRLKIRGTDGIKDGGRNKRDRQEGEKKGRKNEYRMKKEGHQIKRQKAKRKKKRQTG